MEQASDVVELVLPHEVDNPNNVYLYLEGDAWCAYERSAYYLTQMEVRKHPIKYTLYFHKIENSISTLVKS